MAESAPGFAHVVIVGRGLIGGSIELAIAERWADVAVIPLDRGDDLSPVREADLVVLAAPILSNIALLGRLRPLVRPDAVITDTGSTKAATLQAAEGLRFIGGHPVAGSERGGRTHARSDLFAGRPWILTPSASAAEADVARLRAFVEGLGASVTIVDAADHDRLFAFLSHLPQLASSALMSVVGRQIGTESLRLAGTGLRDTTRLAASSPAIWLDILETNRGEVTAALDALIAALTALRDDESGTTLTDTFQRAALYRSELQSSSE